MSEQRHVWTPLGPTPRRCWICDDTFVTPLWTLWVHECVHEGGTSRGLSRGRARTPLEKMKSSSSAIVNRTWHGFAYSLLQKKELPCCSKHTASRATFGQRLGRRHAGSAFLTTRLPRHCGHGGFARAQGGSPRVFQVKVVLGHPWGRLNQVALPS